jgi:hypothetical protein
VAGLQVPLPSQVRGRAAIAVPTGQLPPTQTVPAAYCWQAPDPSQSPVAPQLAAPPSAQVRVGSVPPAGTAEQVPCLPLTAHDMQTPVQSV